MPRSTRPAHAPGATAVALIACVSSPTMLASTAAAQDAVQWRVDDGGNGHWYAVRDTDRQLAFSTAMDLAASMGGHLATIHSLEEAMHVYSVASDGSLYRHPVVGPWIGASLEDGEWTWITGEPWDFQYWYASNPDSPPLEDRACLTNYPGTEGQWNDLPQNGGYSGDLITSSYVMEWSADCNDDGIIDYGQILDGTFADVDSNGVPDPCEQPGGFDGILDVPAEYATIQSAIDAAPEGAVVRMAPGTFVENLVIGSRSIRLVGSGAHQTVLDGNATLPVVRVTDVAELEIHNLRITNGKRTGDQILGGGISAEGVKLILIEDCLIDGNKSDYQGGGLASMNVGMTVVRRTIFTNNLAGPNGGCCGASGGAAVIRGLGGGGPCLGGSSALFEDCLFVRNLAQTNNGLSSLGGAIQHTAAQDGSLHVRRCIFYGNTADYGTAISLATGCPTSVGSVAIEASLVYGSSGSTPAIEGFDLPCTIRDSVICTEDGYPPVSIPFDDGGGNSIGGVCEFPDCDRNGLVDLEQILEGTATDCNGNFIPDECELNDIASFTESRTPTSVADFIEFDVSAMSEAADVVTLEVSAVGDLATTSEFMFVYLDDAQIGLAFVADGASCAPVTNTFSIPAADWNAAGADGSRLVRISGVNIAPDACSDPSTSIRVMVPQPIVDCDANGVWDACDISAGDASDLDGNGVPDSCDPDCDGDGEPDGYEIASGQDLDCNGNLVPDACDLADGGSSNDVDADGVPDECQPDCDADGLPDSWELSEGLAMDCNANGHPDNCDIAEGTSNDIDSNGTPDECKDDCNGNGVPDYWEILKGQVEDCDGNGIPDPCDISAGTLADCDLDGRWDECAIDDGSVTDCNDNRVPDACDIEGGTDEDDNGNGTPDACEIATGDFNLDGCIDSGDLGLLIALWGIQNPPFGDLNGDGVIAAADLGLLIGNWTPCP